MEIFKVLRKKICESNGFDENEVNENTRIIEDLHADSLDLIELSTTIEEVFNVMIPDEHLESMRTVGDIVAFIESSITKNSAIID